MTKIFAAALLAILAGALVVHAMPPEAVASSTPVQPSFDIAMPAPQEPFDTTEITAVETVGASRTE
ncbi:MAG: hypothetical protein H7Y62_13050 [Hyphomicrobium sp.]|nr:hypothetical protein [Hyphomicrobium sp.]